MTLLRGAAACACLSLVAVLSACGGGGGGGGVVPAPAVEVPFSSFAAVQANQTVVLSATAVTANVSGTTDSAGNTTVNSMDFTPEGAGSVRLSYNANRQLSGIELSTPQPNSSTSFTQGTTGHSISCANGVCVAGNPTASAAAVDAFAVQWNYQSFGVWGIGTSPTTAVFGAISAGSLTSGTAIPTVGTFLFSGLTAGFQVDGNGTPFATASSLSASVNFSDRSVLFQTSDMTRVNVNTGVQAPPDPGWNINGTMTYQAGVNSFSGTLNTSNGQLSGQGSGRFYGPSAEELGGTYTLSGTGVNRMIGGFGARR